MSRSREAAAMNAANEKFPKGKALGFALNRTSSILASLLVGEVTYFATNSLGIAAVAISSGLAIKAFLDALTDLVMGAVIDATHSRWGKARPYALAGVLAWLSVIAIFAAPTGLFDHMEAGARNTALVIYIVVFATLESAVFETMRGIAFDTHLKRSIANDDNRIKIMTICGVIFSVGALGMQAALPMLISVFHGAQTGFVLLSVVLGVIGIVGSILCFILCKEYSQEELDAFAGLETEEKPQKEKGAVKEFLRSALKNKYIFMWMVVYFLFSFYYLGAFTSGQYYFQYVFGNLGAFTYVMLSSAVAFPVMFFIPKLCQKFGIINIIRVTMVMALVGVVIRHFFPGSMLAQCIGYFGITVPNIPIAFVGSQLTIECMEYGRYTTGATAEAMYSAFTNFSYKMAGSISGFVLGIILTATGFDRLTAAVQENGFTSWEELAALGTEGFEQYVAGGAQTVENAKNGIILLYDGIPALFIVIILIILIFFRLEKDLKRLRVEHGLNEDGSRKE